MSDEPLYELRKDVSMPGTYWRAGCRKTEKDWKQIFGIPEGHPMHWERDWFIDLRPLEEQPKDEIQELVKEIFARHNIHSITYKETACECIREALTRFKNKDHEPK